MRFKKELWHMCLVYYRKCCNKICNGAMAYVSSILQEVL